MQHDIPQKFRAVRPDYVELPFCFREEFEGGGHRFVTWPSTVGGLHHLLWTVLEHFVGHVHVLLKLKVEASSAETEGDGWNRFYGRCEIAAVSAAIHAHEDVILLDGGSQLCVRSDDGSEYLALDDHGLFYFYSESDWFGGLCRDMKFRDEIRPLISAGGHWHYRPSRAQEQWSEFVDRLGLEAVENAA